MWNRLERYRGYHVLVSFFLKVRKKPFYYRFWLLNCNMWLSSVDAVVWSYEQLATPCYQTIICLAATCDSFDCI
ncbi:unnamed protein product [Arabidopsis halleri]